jgi:hypothetical protein
MTQLKKPVRRVTENSRSASGRAFVIELRPGATDTVFIREAGRRIGYTVPVQKIFQLGARLEADQKRAERAAKRKKK